MCRSIHLENHPFLPSCASAPRPRHNQLSSISPCNRKGLSTDTTSPRPGVLPIHDPVLAGLSWRSPAPFCPFSDEKHLWWMHPLDRTDHQSISTSQSSNWSMRKPPNERGRTIDVMFSSSWNSDDRTHHTSPNEAQRAKHTAIIDGQQSSQICKPTASIRQRCHHGRQTCQLHVRAYRK